MIQASTFQFLKDLAENNNKEWFHANKSAYQAAKDNFLQLTQQLISTIGTFDPAIEASFLVPKKCMKRINRDIRFSADKTPYKANFFSLIKRGGNKSPYVGYYLSMAPESSFLGGGVYMTDNKQLLQFRKAISQQYEQWESIINASEFKAHFEEGVKSPQQLSRPPKGFTKEDPALPYLKYKGFYTQKMLSDAQLVDEAFITAAESAYEAVKPMVDFLNQALENY
jgi:uncharacterized protein (TIGR02453 family)